MLTGEMIVGGVGRSGSGKAFAAIDPASGRALEPWFAGAGAADVADACAQAAAAACAFAETGPEERAGLLDAVVAAIVDLGDVLVERAMAETGLSRARLENERGRTVDQLRLFGEVVRAGEWVGARVDPALPERRPPRPDLRMRRIALGPVAVFGAANFPLAFSVAGGDTAAALAAGCPVVFKGHPAHPGTAELVGRAVAAAVAHCSLPAGVFALLSGAGPEVGAALVRDPRIDAVAFTGSRAGGQAIAALAATRARPIPVYAEMSSVNPVLLLPGALADRASEIAVAFVASMTLGCGQFCTNPGVVLLLDGSGSEAFAAAAAAATAAAPAATMLTPAIHAAYAHGRAALAAHPGVRQLAAGRGDEGPYAGEAALFTTDATTFLAGAHLREEVFGPASLIVRCPDPATLRAVIERLDGQLTFAVHAVAADHALAAELMPLLERKAGRILFNGFGTGVEVGHAMVHGGPYPASSDPRATSVGTLAIERFLRPVCYQDVPAALLPAALRDDNPLGIARSIDGAPERR